MTRTIFTSALILLSGLPVSTNANPTPVMVTIMCGQTQKFEDQMVRVYSEEILGRGIATGRDGVQAIAQVWVSPKGTFTLAMKLQDGQTCLLVDGDNWLWSAAKLPPQL